MDTILIELWTTALPVVVNLVGLVLTYLLAQASAWLQERIHNERVTAVLDRLDVEASVAVSELNQTVVQGLKTTAANAWTADAAREIRDQAIEAIRMRLGPAAMRVLDRELGGSSATANLMIGRIEKAVASSKRSTSRKPEPTRPMGPPPGAWMQQEKPS
jgi:hypothetical protein